MLFVKRRHFKKIFLEIKEMKKYRKVNKMSSEGLQLKKAVMGNRVRAKFVGFILLLAVVGLAVAVAVLPMLKGTAVTLTITKFWKGFQKVSLKTSEGLTKLIVTGLYTLMLLGLIVNVFRALGKLKMLNKKKGTKEDGFNHSAYAMHDLGKIFSGSLLVIIMTYFLIYLASQGAKVNGFWLAIVLGAGVIIRLFTGVVGGKIKYFDFEGEELVEQKREVGRLAPFVRNVLQLAGVFTMLYFLLCANAQTPIFSQLITTKFVSVLTESLGKLIVTIALAVVVLCVFVLAKHATGIAEYSIDGARGRGMKTYRVFSLFTFLAAATAVVSKLVVLKETKLDVNLTVVAGIALFGFIVEIVMRKLPRDFAEKKVGEEGIAIDDAKMKTEEQTNGEETVLYPLPQIPGVPAVAGLPVQGNTAQGNGNSVYMVYYPIVMPVLQGHGVHTQPSAVNPDAQVKPANETPSLPAPEEEKEEYEQEVVKTKDGPRVEVDCPFCKKRLRVNSGAKYHRCPVCDRVFAIRGKSED